MSVLAVATQNAGGDGNVRSGRRSLEVRLASLLPSARHHIGRRLTIAEHDHDRAAFVERAVRRRLRLATS
jgi:hypothetical protein